MFSILFVLISRTPLFFLKAISFFIYIFARTLKVSHLKITKKNIDHCFGDNKELVNKSFRETMELSLIFPFIWGKKDNYKKLIDPDYLQNKSLEKYLKVQLYQMHQTRITELTNADNEYKTAQNVIRKLKELQT